MKKLFTILALTSALAASAQERTLRLDYVFSGSASEAQIALSGASSAPLWAGRRSNLSALPLKGNGCITMRSGTDTLWRQSFSTLFQEWQNTEEATRLRRSFENVFLLPFPSRPVEITVELFDSYARPAAVLTHTVDPSDIQIRPAAASGTPVRDIRIGGPADKCIDVVIVAEGYTEKEMQGFYDDASKAVDAILSHEPFRTLKDRFNFRAVAAASADSGVSIPHEGIWKDTPLHSQFDTFGSERYLTTLHLGDLHDILSGVPCEQIIILANTSIYGGGGIYGSFTLTAARHPLFRQVVVHEFGHSFAGLADEYFYDDQYSDAYHPEIEPWEPNITTKADFASKWEDMMGRCGVDLFEGGGYMSKGVWRASRNCRMRTNEAPRFCPVCRRAIERMIRYLTEGSEPE